MNNNGIIKYKENFIIKIKIFFKRIFGKGKVQYNNYSQEEYTNKIEEKQQNNFINDIKLDTKIVDSVIEKKNFLEEINGNEEALNMLSIDRLKKLERYYDGIIAENEKKIRKLKETA